MKRRSLRLTVVSLVMGMVLCTPIFQVSAALNYEKEENGTRATATTIAANTDMQGNIASSKDIDYYKVVIATPSKIELKFSHGDSNKDYGWDVTFYSYKDYNLTELTSFTATTEDNIVFSSRLRVSAGTYYVLVEPHYSWSLDTSTYTVRVKSTDESTIKAEREVNNTRAQATPISANTYYAGNIQRGDDLDYYKLTVKTPSTLQIGFLHGDLLGSYGWTATIYRYADKQLTELTSYDIEPLVNLSFGPKVRVPAGTYYVKVEPESAYNWRNNQYKVKVKVNDESAVKAEREANNTRATATSIKKGATYVGNIQRVDDLDFYKFTNSATSVSRLVFKHPEVNSGSWKITLYSYKNSTLTKLYYFVSYYTEDSIKCSAWRSLPAGTYYILIEPYYTYNFNYQDYTIKCSNK